MKRILTLCLAAALLLGCIPHVNAVHESFFNTHGDWHFDLTKEPDRAMTVEEFIALTTAYSYWSVGSEGEPQPDRDGNLPSEWAAPYIVCETNKLVINPSELDYDAPATLAFAMKFFANSKGLYGYDAVNLRSFTGTEGLTVEERLCLNTAVDYGIFPYSENMDVSVTLRRRDVETKYMIPAGKLEPACKTIEQAGVYGNSMIFFEDCYNDREASQRQVDLLKENADNFTCVSLDTIYFTVPKAQESGSGEFTGSFIEHPLIRNDPQLELIAFCKAEGITVLGGVQTWYNDSSMALVANDEAAMDRAVEELVGIVLKYDLDGLNIDIELYGNTYRDAYSRMVTKLSARLHEMDKLLMLTVGGRIWKKDELTGLYDYDVVDTAADLINIITYDLHSANSYSSNRGEYGEMSNYTFTSRCLRYAVTKFGAERVLLGLSGYAICYNTTDHTAKNIPVSQANALQQKYGAALQTSGERADDCYFTYTEDGKDYIVYRESEEGTLRRIKLATRYAIGGVSGFHIGGEDQYLFDTMGKYCSPIPFTDVSPEAWYFENVEYAYEHALFNGITPSTFEPETCMTRAMLVTVLWRLSGEPEPESEAAFSDVAPKEWYQKPVAWANENNIVNGMGHNLFCPEENVTREQLAVILFRYAKLCGVATEEAADLSAFPDVQTVSPYACRALQWAVGEGLINGVAHVGSRESLLEPLGSATRAQVAAILMRFMQSCEINKS